MATGRQVQLTKHVGEYLVAAELSRRGLLTATFAGNVPDYDIVATGSRGQTALVQVKAIAGPSWQFAGHLRTCAARPERRRWGNRRPRQPATSSACAFDSNRTERTASTCSAGRNSSACSSTATGATWSATAVGDPSGSTPSTRRSGKRTSSPSWTTGRSSTCSRRSQRRILVR